jgi:hypothetical protein
MMVAAVRVAHALLGPSARVAANVWRFVNLIAQIKNAAPMVARESVAAVPAMAIAPPMAPALATLNVKRTGSVGIMVAAEIAARAHRRRRSVIRASINVSPSAPPIVTAKNAVTMAVEASAVLALGLRPFATPARSFVSLNAARLVRVSPVAQMVAVVLVVSVRKPTLNVMTIRANVFVCHSVRKGKSAVTMAVMGLAVRVAMQARAATTTISVFVNPNARKVRSVVTMAATAIVVPARQISPV